MRVIRALVIAALTAILLSTPALAQWPTTCVSLNDIVENHLGNYNNVGIYQRVFGDQAEQACQNDHRDDVRGVFAWAFPEGVGLVVPVPAPGATSPSITPAELEAKIDGFLHASAAHTNTGNESVQEANAEIISATAAIRAGNVDTASTAVLRAGAHWADADDSLRKAATEISAAAATAATDDYVETSRLLYSVSTSLFVAAGFARQISDINLEVAELLAARDFNRVGPLLAESQRISTSLAELMAAGADELRAAGVALSEGR